MASKNQLIYIGLRNGVLVVKRNNFSIINCEFVSQKDLLTLGNFNLSSYFNVWYVNYGVSINENKESIKMGQKNISGQMTVKLLQNFNLKLMAIFNNQVNVHLFLQYLAKLLLFLPYIVDTSKLEQILINQQTHLITIGDTNDYVKHLVKLLVPNFFELVGVYDKILIFEKESWRKNKHFETIINKDLSEKTSIKLLGDNSILTHSNMDHTNFIQVHECGDIFARSGPNVDASILLWMMITSVNTKKISKGIKKRHNCEMRDYLNSIN